MLDFHDATSWTLSRRRFGTDGMSSTHGSVPGSLEMVGRLSNLQSAVFDAIRGKFPVVYGFIESDKSRLTATSPGQLIGVAQEKITEAREFMQKHRHLRPPNALD